MPSSEDDWTDDDTDDRDIGSGTGGTGVEPAVQPTSEPSAAQQAQLADAQRAVEAAQDDLADLEGKVVVCQARLAETENETNGSSRRVAAREALASAERAFIRGGRRLEAAEARAAATATLIAEEAAAEAAAAEVVVPPPVPRFASVDLFVTLFVLPNMAHRYDQNRLRWCRQWWEHAEAITRLEALWEGFEVMRRQPAPSLSTWLRDHFDPHMRALTDPVGVFWKCSADTDVHEIPPSWPVLPAPDGMFATIEEAQIGAADLPATTQDKPPAEPAAPSLIARPDRAQQIGVRR